MPDTSKHAYRQWLTTVAFPMPYPAWVEAIMDQWQEEVAEDGRDN